MSDHLDEEEESPPANLLQKLPLAELITEEPW